MYLLSDKKPIMIDCDHDNIEFTPPKCINLLASWKIYLSTIMAHEWNRRDSAFLCMIKL